MDGKQNAQANIKSQADRKIRALAEMSRSPSRPSLTLFIRNGKCKISVPFLFEIIFYFG